MLDLTALAKAKQHIEDAENALRKLIDGPRGDDFHEVHKRLLADLTDAMDAYLSLFSTKQFPDH
jgi:hypothetical protein